MGDSVRPSRELTLMKVAHDFADRSTCSRAHVGAVFARDGRVLVTGYNGAPAGMPHCDHTCDCVPMVVEDPVDQVPPQHRVDCASKKPCIISVHAEANAVSFAAKHGVSLERSELYTTFTPCLPCAQLVINVGVVLVYACEAYRDNRGVQLLRNVGIEVVDLSIH